VVIKVAVLEMRQALGIEVTEVRRRGGHAHAISNGRCVVPGTQPVYIFETDSMLLVPDDSPVKLKPRGGRTYSGSLLSARGTTALVELDASSHEIGTRVPSGYLITDPTFLLEELAERLGEIGVPSGSVAAELLAPRDAPVGRQREPMSAAGQGLRLNNSQLRALEAVLTQRVSFVWGPPGTGKTKTLAASVTALAAKGERVLLCAHSNVALDTAMESVLERLDRHGAGRIVLRYGSVTPEFRESLEPISVRGHLRTRRPDQYAKLVSLEEEEERLLDALRKTPHDATAARELQRVQLRLSEWRKQVREWERRLVAKSKVLGCTLSKMAIDEAVHLGRYDAVLVDEASMALCPAVFYAASLANKRLAIFGDFRQLAPICISEEDLPIKWLKTDIFDHGGVSRVWDKHPGRVPRMAMLRTQYRMHPSISAVVNEFAYSGRLRDASGIGERLAPVVEAPPEPGAAIVLRETAPLGDCCHTEKADNSWSRFNPRSAAESVRIALLASASKVSVGIITPFAAQARLLRAMLRDVGAADEVQASTVHRFQGSEKDVIVLDLGEGSCGQEEPSILLRDADVALRLLNVAASRARGKLVVVGPIQWLSEQRGHEQKRFLRIVRQGNPVLADGPSIGDREYAGMVSWVSREDTGLGWDLLGKDLLRDRGKAAKCVSRHRERIVQAGDVTWLVREPASAGGAPWLRLSGRNTAAALAALLGIERSEAPPVWFPDDITKLL